MSRNLIYVAIATTLLFAFLLFPTTGKDNKPVAQVAQVAQVKPASDNKTPDKQITPKSEPKLDPESQKVLDDIKANLDKTHESFDTFRAKYPGAWLCTMADGRLAFYDSSYEMTKIRKSINDRCPAKVISIVNK